MKPILFNTEMVKAILDGRKTVTRRVVKFRDGKNPNWTGYVKDGLILYNGNNEPCNMSAPFEGNDILYVRETWSDHYEPNEEGKPELQYCYKADGIDVKAECLPGENNRWYPSIHMPKEVARIFLKVTSVRMERLRDITEEQAKAEGVIHLFDHIPDAEYTNWAKKTGQYPKRKEEWGYKNYLWHGNFGAYGGGNWKSDLWDYQYSAYDTAVDSFSSLWQSTLQKDQLQYYGWDANPYVWVIEFEVINKATAMTNDMEKGGVE